MEETTSPSNQLYLVRENQTRDEPLHWSLMVCDADNANYSGNIYQVTGDALNMFYNPNPV